MDPDRQLTAQNALPQGVDALRIQVAAVAAQQIALDEQEQRLAEDRAAFEEQEARAALHWEEKRRELEELFERAQAERAAIEKDRQASEQHLERLTADLGPAQREILAAEKQVQNERRRLSGMQQKFKQRWREHWRRKEQQLAAQQSAQDSAAAALAQRELNLRQAETELYERRLRCNGEAELSQRALGEKWAELRRAQFRWRHRRNLERAAMRVRAHQLEAAAQQIAQARSLLDRDQRAWLTQRQALELELDGVNTRIQNLRQEMHEPVAQTPRPEVTAETATTALVPVASESTEVATAFDPVRIVDLDRLADELIDQRRQIVETWSRLVAVNDQWHAERAALAVEIEAQGQRLLERDLLVQAREQANQQVEDSLQQRHDALERVQNEIVAWRTRLRVDENALESDKTRLVAESNDKSAAAEHHLAELIELRQRWAKRRQKELENLQSERAMLELFRRDFARLRREMLERAAAVEEEKRVLTEKALALEQYRDQVVHRSGADPQAERRLERLRRRWLTHNAEAIRQASRERAALQAELAALEKRYEGLVHQATEVAAAAADQVQKQTAWEEQQILAEQQHAELRLELRRTQAQRDLAEQQIAALRDEIEGIARTLLDQPEPPSLSFERAA